MKTLFALLFCLLLFPPSVYAQSEPNTPQEILDSMSVEQKVTQTLMPDFRNWLVDGEEVGVTELNDDIRTILQEYEFGGVILFAENVVETEQTTRLVYDMQQTMVGSDLLPLLIGIDQEGGIVNRLGTGTELPGNMALGATGDATNSQLAGNVIGRELQALGINVNFAPVVDVNNNPKNPVIGLRSFSSDPNIVAEHGVAYIEGLNEYGIASAAKHFPGHGDIDVDSHVGLPLVDKSLEELMATELVPFQAAMDAEVDMIMTAHIQFPQLDNTTVTSAADGTEVLLPATLSENILTDLVRDELGYEGLIVTDALNMEAIAANFGETDAVVLSKQAGADILLMPTIIRSNEDLAKLDAVIEALVGAVEAGEIPMENLDTSVLRILELKQTLGLLEADFLSESVDEVVAEAEEAVGSAENRAAERDIALKAITLLENKAGILPLRPESGERVLFITADPNQQPGSEFSIERLRQEGTLSSDFAYEILSYDDTSTLDDFTAAIDAADHIVVYTSMASEESLSPEAYTTAIPQGIFTYASEAGKDTIQVSINKPYDAVNFTDIGAVLLSYGYNGMDPTEGGKEPETSFGPNIPAVVEAIFGATPTGQLPVDLPAIENGVLSTEEIAYPVGYSFGE